MHYGDAFHCQNNILVMSIHIHSVMGSDDVEIQLNSVLEAKLCDPAELMRILKNPRRYFKRYYEIVALQRDARYIVTLVANEIGDYKLTSIEEISAESAAWKKLH